MESVEQSNLLVTDPVAGHAPLSKSTENSDWRNRSHSASLIKTNECNPNILDYTR